MGAQAKRYLLVLAVNYILQAGTVEILCRTWKVNIYIGSFAGIVLTTITGYVLLNSWVFAVQASSPQMFDARSGNP